LFRQYEARVAVGSNFHFSEIFVAIWKDLLDLTMVSIPNNGWDTATIILFLNNIFISFFDAIEYLMYLATIYNSSPALDGLAPLLQITNGNSHIMYFFTILIVVTRYLSWLKAVNSFKLYLLLLDLVRAFHAYVIMFFELLLQNRDI